MGRFPCIACIYVSTVFGRGVGIAESLVLFGRALAAIAMSSLASRSPFARGAPLRSRRTLIEASQCIYSRNALHYWLLRPVSGPWPLSQSCRFLSRYHHYSPRPNSCTSLFPYLMALKSVGLLRNKSVIWLGCLDNFWATNEKTTQLPRNPRRLKNAFREYNRSSSSVRNDAKMRRMLAMIMWWDSEDSVVRTRTAKKTRVQYSKSL